MKAEVMNLIIDSFLKIREGMTLYLLHTCNNELNKSVIDVTFENLISAKPVPEQNLESHQHLIELLHNNERLLTFFLEAMRIKTMLLSKLGEIDEGFKLRMNLSEVGLSISEYILTDNPMNPDEFIKESQSFLDECRLLYNESIVKYKEYYPQ